MPYYDFNQIATKLDEITEQLKRITPKETPHEYKQLGELNAVYCSHCGDIKKVPD